MRYDHTTLDNGLQIIGEYSPEANSMATGFFCRTGARDETPAINGVSHFLEHMMFKGTETLDYDHINKTFDKIGARYNAFTSEENTVYFGQVLPEFQSDILGLLAQMMRPALRGTDFDMEKNVILEEIAMYADQPLWVAHDFCRQLHSNGHPLGYSVLGSPECIKALTRDAMAEYFNRRYAADNLTLAFSGKYDWDAGVEQAKRLCGEWTPSGAQRSTEPVDCGSGFKLETIERFNQAHFYMLAPGLSAQDDDRLVASVAAAAIGSGEASRLHWALVDPGLAEAANLSHDEEDHYGVYAGVVVCAPENAGKALELFRAELDKAQTAGLGDDEVARAVRRFGTSAVLQAESPLHRLVSVGFDWVYRGRVTPIEEFVAKLRTITAADCNRVLAKRPFDQLATACVGPMTSL